MTDRQQNNNRDTDQHHSQDKKAQQQQNGGVMPRSRKASALMANGRGASSDHQQDFVSADVNEVLEDARQILTNQKQQRKEGERVLDESTRVKVTKTGGDEDPLEVSVWRSRLVKRRDEEEDEQQRGAGLEEDRGWSSDTDLAMGWRARRVPSIHKCAHRKVGSIGSIGVLGGEDDQMISERHTSVKYRRRYKDDLWRREETDEDEEEQKERKRKGHPGEQEEEDNAQLKVEITEECTTQKGEHLVTQTWEIQWSVQNFHSLPDWLQDNEFLHTGHRPPLPSFAMCFKSILSLHTETGNIWTHLIGCLAFFLLALWFLTRPDTHIQFQEKLVFSFFFLGAILCLGLSFTFHTVSCHSKHVVRIFSRLDYMGISLLIVGSFIPWIYYGFYCRREPKITYIAMIGVMGIAAIIVSLWEKFNDKRYRPLRACIFSFMGLSGIVPTIHFVYTDGMRRLIDENSFYWLLTMAILYLFGALLYATRTPERFFPGKCDLVFQSHQLFHLCVVCAAFTHYYGISEMAMNRLTGTCPIIGQSGQPILHNEL